MQFLNYLCLAILQIIRSDIVEDEFSYVMEKVQRISHLDVELIIKVANDLYEKFENKIVEENHSIKNFMKALDIFSK